MKVSNHSLPPIKRSMEEGHPVSKVKCVKSPSKITEQSLQERIRRLQAKIDKYHKQLAEVHAITQACEDHMATAQLPPHSPNARARAASVTALQPHYARPIGELRFRAYSSPAVVRTRRSSSVQRLPPSLRPDDKTV